MPLHEKQAPTGVRHVTANCTWSLTMTSTVTVSPRRSLDRLISVSPFDSVSVKPEGGPAASSCTGWGALCRVVQRGWGR